MRFYVDTSIWLGYFEDRRDSIRPLGEFAFQFLKGCKKLGTRLLYSEAVIVELQGFSKKWVNEMFLQFRDLLVETPVLKKQTDEAKTIAKQRGLPYNDALHAIIARDNKAIIVTRDKHFEELRDIVEAKTPEELL